MFSIFKLVSSARNYSATLACISLPWNKYVVRILRQSLM